MIYKLLQFLIGFLIIGLIIWNRLFRVRETRVFKDLGYNQTLLIISLICALLFTIFLVLELYKLYYPTRKEALYQKLKIDNIIIMIQSAPAYVYEKLTERIPLRRLIELPASYFIAYFEYPRVFVIMFYYLPQLIVATTFVAETIFFDQRVVFIKTLNLLIIFLLCRTMIYIFKQYSLRRKVHFELYLDILIDNRGIQFALRHPRDMPPSPPGLKMADIISQYNDMCPFWFLYYSIYNYMVAIESFNNQYAPYVRIYMFVCYLIGWLYLFLYLLLFQS